MKHLLSITIALLPTAVIAEQFTPQQLIEVMTKSPENRDIRVHDGCVPSHPHYLVDSENITYWRFKHIRHCDFDLEAPAQVQPSND